MIAALQKAANRNARGGSRKVPASTQAPATARIQPSVQPMPAQPTPDWMPKGLVVLRVGPQKDQHRSQPRQWRHGVQHQQHQRQQTPPPKPTQAPPHLRHIQRRQAQADALLKHVPPCNYQRALGMSHADFENANDMAQLRLELRDRLADAKGNLQACRTTLTTLRNYLVERDRLPRTARFIEGTVSDYYLGAYLTNVTDSATGRKTRRVALEKLRDSCGFCFDVGLEARKKIPNLAPAQRHAKLLQSGAVPKGKPALEPREQRHLELLAADTTQPMLIRQSAGMASAPGIICLRYANAQRCGQWADDGNFITGVCGGDYKKPVERTLWRWFVATRRGISGSDTWYTMMRSGLVGVEQQMFVLRDTNSPDGDLRRATAFIDGLMEHGRALKLLRSLLAIPVTFGGALERPPSDPTRTRQVTYKYARRLLPAIALANGEKLEDTNEIGAWAGSQAERVDAGTLSLAMGQANDRIHQCASLYGTEGTAARVPFIMERTVDSVRAAFLSKGATAFPPQGGLSVVSAMREARRQTPTSRPVVFATTVLATPRHVPALQYAPTQPDRAASVPATDID